ncbi:MAG TPA: trypsin-like peptidase domain-containing protein [Anaerovoracaceae bacterium]|nr:trypsin-like peptidase domain-containing protein [Anaerovoracaceae bacterium]
MKMKRSLIGIFALVLTLTCAVSLPSSANAAATSPDSSNARLNQIISILNDANGKIPESITRSDMELFLKEGGSQVGSILAQISSKSLPIEDLSSGNFDSSSQKNNLDEARNSYSYNPITGSTSYVDGSTYDKEVPDGQTSDGSIISEGSGVKPLDYPPDWYEYDPQNYSNTRSTCKLIIKLKNSSTTYLGSGFMIAPNYIATAGHCIYQPDFGGWCDYLIVTPSNRSGNPTQPYGSALSTTVEVGGDWYNGFSENDDWGVAELSQSMSTGYLGLLDAGDNIIGWGTRAQGYPGSSEDLYLTGGNVLEASGRYIHTTNIVVGGMSGGPLLEGRDYIIAIVTGKYDDNTSRMVKLDDWLFNKLNSYR